MENVTTTASSGLSETLQAFYDTELLENAKPALVYAQLAKVQPLPAGNGNTVQWRKWNNFEKAEQLTEGVIPDGQMFGLSTKTGTLNQYSTIGYKLVTNGATILYPERVLQVWSTSSFTGVDEANALIGVTYE